MKEVYNFTRGNQVAVHPYLKKKKLAWATSPHESGYIL